ncbi:MAG: DUF3667 domain-containing protein [Sphingobacteriales bacterium]|nr:DUF3667 domain-containing protein [Sphingobacteriales bacterium]
MQDPSCKNCGDILTLSQRFCPHCGQKTGIPRITTRSLVKEFFQTIFHAEKGIINLLRGLALHPGTVISEYVGGKRKKYFNPFTFFGLCVAFMVLINSWVKPESQTPGIRTEVINRLPDERMKNTYISTVKKDSQIQGFLSRNMNFSTLITAPFFALFLWLFFRQRGKNYAEITVAYILLTAFATVLYSIIIMPWHFLFKGNLTANVILFAGLILESIYYAWGLKTFFGYNTFAGYRNILLVLWLAGITGFILLLGVYYVYVYGGGRSVVIQYL